MNPESATRLTSEADARNAVQRMVSRLGHAIWGVGADSDKEHTMACEADLDAAMDRYAAAVRARALEDAKRAVCPWCATEGAYPGVAPYEDEEIAHRVQDSPRPDKWRRCKAPAIRALLAYLEAPDEA